MILRLHSETIRRIKKSYLVETSQRSDQSCRATRDTETPAHIDEKAKNMKVKRRPTTVLILKMLLMKILVFLL